MLVAVLSVKGSPGVTTFAVALAARWPESARALLVEADPSGGDIATRFSLEPSPGLVSLAVAARRGLEAGSVWRHAQALPGGLPVVTAPPDADRARAALSALAAEGRVLRQAADARETVVIADCGRVDASSPAMPFVRAADVMVLLTRARADDLAHLARRLPEMSRWCRRSVLLLVGDGYSPTEVGRELGVPPLCRVPDDPRGAGVLCGRPSRSHWGHGGPSLSALGRVAHKVAKVLTAEQPAPAAVPVPRIPETQPVPVLRAVPGVPDTPVSVRGLRQMPDGGPWGGAAS